MTGVHDMGGRFGDGPVVPEPQGVAQFAAPWHPRALALTLAAGGIGAWNLDRMRRAREALGPADYARFGYYEKWIAALADMLVENRLVSRAELSRGTAETAADPRRVTAGRMAQVIATGAPASRNARTGAKFSVGDRVRTLRPGANRLCPGGHTRLPAYAAGASGVIGRCHGNHVLPDSNAHGLGEAPEPLYAVRFAAAELWANPEHPGDTVVLDLWQSYLVAAS